MLLAPAATAEVAPRAQGWIVDARTDLVWFILPVVTGYLCLYASVGLGVSSFLVWWFWNVAVNGPHFYATISRTYLDRREWQERAPLLVGSLGFILIGPAAIGLSLATASAVPFLLFWFFQAIWAYLHVARQHYGFLTLYQRRGGEVAGAANRADYWLFHLLMFGPLAAWALRYPALRDAMGLGPSLSSVERAVIAATGPGVAVLVALYVAKEVVAWRARGMVNLPKSLLLAAYLPLHLLILLWPGAVGSYDLLLFNAALTFPHNLQYLALVWFYSKNRYHADADGRTYGLASVAARSLPRFALLGVAFSLVFFYVEWYLEGRIVPFSLGRSGWAHLPLGPTFTTTDLIAVTWIGFVFNHYYLDQRIWRVSRDQRLMHDLRL